MASGSADGLRSCAQVESKDSKQQLAVYLSLQRGIRACREGSGNLDQGQKRTWHVCSLVSCTAPAHDWRPGSGGAAVGGGLEETSGRTLDHQPARSIACPAEPTRARTTVCATGAGFRTFLRPYPPHLLPNCMRLRRFARNSESNGVAGAQRPHRILLLAILQDRSHSPKSARGAQIPATHCRPRAQTHAGQGPEVIAKAPCFTYRGRRRRVRKSTELGLPSAECKCS